MHLDELGNRGRQEAARVGMPGSATAQGDSAVSDSGNTDSQDADAAKPKRGRDRPRKTGITKPAQSAAEAGPESSSSVVQFMLLAVFGDGHSWSV